MSLTDRCHRAGDLVGVGHNTVEDGADRAPDVVLRIFVGAIGVVNCLCVSLLRWDQGAISVESKGAGIAKVVPWDLTYECVHFVFFNKACVAVGY